MSNSLERRKKKVIKELESNPVVQVACVRAGIPRATMYRWMSDDILFKESVETAKEKGYEMGCDMAESQILKKIKEGNFPASKFWLETHSERYRNKRRHSEQREEKQGGWGELLKMAMDQVEAEGLEFDPKTKMLVKKKPKTN